MINATFIFPVIRSDFIEKAIKSLYKYTNMANNRVIVIDQSEDVLCLDESLVHLYLRPHRNLGFAKAVNEGIIHGLHWNSQYIVSCNDDIEIINYKWWDGILQTFAMDDNILIVNPECPRVPLWGYGRPHEEYVDTIDYKEKFTDADYDFLLKGNFEHLKEKYGDFLPKALPLHKEGVCDAIAMWMPVFRLDCFEKIGLLDEKFFPGAGEDYDYDGRVYAEGYRAVGSTKSWVWHWWGKSKDKQKDINIKIDPKYVWNSLGELWPDEWNLSWDAKEGKMKPKPFDPWATCFLQDGTRVPMKRKPEITVVDI
jgi:GT2 family glycosyltransferase